MTAPRATAAPTRLFTVFGTVLYVDAATGELRHGAVETSPGNAGLLDDDGAGRLAHGTDDAIEPIVCTGDGSWSKASRPELAGAASFAIEQRETGSVGLAAGGRYLSARDDGAIVHSTGECGARERFRAAFDEAGEPAPIAIFPGREFTRFHLGCGPNFIAGFLNIDLRSDIEPGRLLRVSNVAGAYFACFDLSQGVPGCDNSLDLIYHCHFLEHLGYPEAIRLLQQARLRLKPGGRMRLLVPDLELWIANYQHNNTSFFDAYRRHALRRHAELFPTKGAVFMGMLHQHGHRWGYDFETLNWLLRDIGFTDIERTLFQESRIPEIALMEPYTALRGMESLCVECRKPALPGG